MYGLRTKERSEPCQTSKMEYFVKTVYGFYFRKRHHLSWKPLPVFARRFIFDGWYDPEYSSGVWKYTRRKIGKFSRISWSVILETAFKYLKSICFYKDYIRDLHGKFADFCLHKSYYFMLWPTDQNSLNFLHLWINSITIYLKPRAEATIQRRSFKSCSLTQECYFEQLFCFFSRQNSQVFTLFRTSFFNNFASCRPLATPVKVVYFEF